MWREVGRWGINLNGSRWPAFGHPQPSCSRAMRREGLTATSRPLTQKFPKRSQARSPQLHHTAAVDFAHVQNTSAFCAKRTGSSCRPGAVEALRVSRNPPPFSHRAKSNDGTARPRIKTIETKTAHTRRHHAQGRTARCVNMANEDYSLAGRLAVIQEGDRIRRCALLVVNCIRKMRLNGLADMEIVGLFHHAADELDKAATDAAPVHSGG
jgi:hypothetical protein